MDYNFCEISDEDKEILIQAMSDKIWPIIEEFKEKIPPPPMCAFLIHTSKELLFSCGMNYYSTIGMLNEMLNCHLEEIYNRFNEEEKKEE